MTSPDRILFAICTAGLLSACRLELTVPPGGRVEGFFLHGCGEAQTCTITVDHHNFREDFSALPAEGYRFAGWKRGDGHFCSGRVETCSLSSRDSAGTALERLLRDGEATFYLEPVFERTYPGDGDPVQPALVINVSYHQQNYPVDGTNRYTWYRGIQSDANPLAAGVADGLKYAGYFEWTEERSRYWYRYSDGHCSLTRYEKNYSFSTTLPEPHYPAGRPGPKALEYFWEIVLHEGAHARITRRLIQRRSERINTLFSPFSGDGIRGGDGCRKAIQARLAAINEETVRQYESETEVFHSYHNLPSWGRCQPPNPFMNTLCPEGM